MEVAAYYVIVPFAFAALITGLVMALGTSWGVFRHYWVVFSLLLTVIAIVVLLFQLEPISEAATLARDPATQPDALSGAASQALHAGVGLLVLLVITALNVFKPRGLTPYGERKRREERSSR